jgi:hypothetical protein
MAESFQSQVVAFDQSLGLALLDNAIDLTAGTIKGVSLATAGVEAIGHGEYDETTQELIREFWTDATTLETMLVACLAIGQPLKAKLEHGTGLSEVVGTFDNFRIDGDHLRADFTAIPTSAGVAHLFSLADRISRQFGVSVTALLQKVKQGGVDLMRCMKIESADFVDAPAINAGLFSAKTKFSKLTKNQTQIMTEEEINALIAEALKPMQEQLTTLVEGMPEELSADELEAEATAAAALEAEGEASKAEMSALKASMTALETKNSTLEANLATATAESKKLGISFGASLQVQEAQTKQTDSFSAEMSKKTGEGKAYHVALMELTRENPKLVNAEAAQRGVYVSQL